MEAYAEKITGLEEPAFFVVELELTGIERAGGMLATYIELSSGGLKPRVLPCRHHPKWLSDRDCKQAGGKGRKGEAQRSPWSDSKPH